MTSHSFNWGKQKFSITDGHFTRALAAGDSREPRRYPPSESFDEAKKTAVVLAHMDAVGGALNASVSDQHIHRALQAMSHFYDPSMGLNVAVLAGAVLAYMDAMHENQSSMNLLSLIAEEGIDNDYLKNWAVRRYNLIDPRAEARSGSSDSERALWRSLEAYVSGKGPVELEIGDAAAIAENLSNKRAIDGLSSRSRRSH